MDYIEWNYIQAKKQADKLLEQAERLESLAACRLEEGLQGISGSWRGENAGAYIRKGERMKRELIRLSAELKKTAAAIRASAERTYRAEKLAKAIACRRIY